MSHPRTPVDVDLLDPDVYAVENQPRLWRRLQDDCPVGWHEPKPGVPGFWVLSRYADIMEVFKDPATFSSARGNILGTLLAGGDPAGGQMLAVTDPPRHRDLRRILQGGFSARSMRRIADSVRVVARRLVAEAVERGGCDFVADVAARIPLEAICELLAVPVEDRPRMLELTSTALDADSTPLAAARAQSDIMNYYAKLVPERRANPQDDAVSMLAVGVIDGRPLTEVEVYLNCYNLIIGGDETTRFSAAGGLLALIQHPDQWRVLKERPDVIDSAVEEVVRWTSPALHIARVATVDTTIRGARISAGEIVSLWIGAANRDVEVFEDPYTFNLARTPNRHMAYGFGPHFCLGGALARIEMQILFEEIRNQAGSVSLAGDVEYSRSNFLAGVSRLPVTFTRDRAEVVPTAGHG
ncbi:cytochrome P450 [Dactylosporangium fulvum]|uniref:Cytochrome P450 n=1 Tax=Dactylosporangium fulvum TaxID=53359 RepID=A0ABY5W7U3_9ACTN|nr:cytochrome P450 [Dactylosporangium fulvum]UWP85386.1 cytochrome P450 [Dactylosporangium fulvum]